MHNLTRYLADAHIEDLRRDARRAHSVPVGAGDVEAPVLAPITIRRAEPSDAAALKRVANPFHETVAIVELLEAWARHELKGRDAGLRHRLRRAVRRRNRRVNSADRGRPAWEIR